MPRVIALSGLAGSGKNTVAKLLGGVEISFAEPLKRFCQEVFDFSDAQLYGPSSERNRPDLRYPIRCHGCQTCGFQRDHFIGHLTPRQALQTLGTEWGRACYENVWADLGVRRALAVRGPLAIITDCRFINEARAVRAAGGEVWRIIRPGAGLEGATGAHPSEAEQESDEFLELVNRTVDNDGGLQQLAVKVGCL